jgi:hypothetical protein
MTWDGLLAIGLNVVLPFFMAVAGGILAALSLGEGKRRQQWAWITLFVFLALAAIVLAFVQQVRLSTQQAASDRINAEIQAKANGETKYTQGELDAIQKVLVQLAKNSDPKNAVALFNALAAIRLQSPSSAPTATSVPFSLTNGQMAKLAQNSALRFRELQEQLDIDFQSDRLKNHSSFVSPDFMERELQKIQPARIDARGLRELILKRLPQQPQNSTVSLVLDENSISGARPLNEVAEYFDELARLLLGQETPTSK